MHSRLLKLWFGAVAVLCAWGVAALAAERPTVEVRDLNGRPTVYIDGKPDALPGYSPMGWDPAAYRKQLPRFAQYKMGVYFVSPPRLFASDIYWNGDAITATPQPTKPPVDDKLIDEQADIIMAKDPGAWMIIRFGTLEPESWRKLHPEELVLTETGERLNVPSLASDAYWEAAAKLSAAVVQCYEGRPWASRIIGYANFERTEGTHESAIMGWLYDHSAPMQAKWRAFLRAQYGTEEKLRAAFRDDKLTFETVAVPRDRLRGTVTDVAQLLYWQPAAENQPLRDWLELQRDLYHAGFLKLQDAMQAAAGRKVLILHDALKQTMQGWDITDFFVPTTPKAFAEPELMAASGHMDAARLLSSAGCSGLITPHDYQHRGSGGVFEPEGAADSAVLRGRLFFTEMDTRTYATNLKRPDYGTAMDLREFDAVTWRNWATAATRGWNFYWMDLCGDWFSAPEMAITIGAQVNAWRQALTWKHETVPGIAVIIDDQAALETNGAGNYLSEAVLWQIRQGLAHCGIPYRVYLLDDLELANFPAHRVYYFPNLFRVDDRRLKLLQDKVFRDGNVVVWGPGSGISDGSKIGVDSVKKLTGFDCEMIPANFSHRVQLTNFEHPITRGLAADLNYGGPLGYGPLLFPKNGTALGRALTKQGLMYAGLSVLEVGKGAAGATKAPDKRGAGDYASVFTTAVPVPAELWRSLGRYAGAHVYCDTNDVVLADRSIVALHSLQSGDKLIRLPTNCKITDVTAIEQKPQVRRGKEIRIKLQAPETRVFRLE